MMKFQLTLTSAAVAVVLASSAANVSANNFSNKNNANTSSMTAKNAVAAQKQLAAKSSTSGMTNHFDAKLGKATFLWANDEIKKPDLGAIAIENRLAMASDYYMSQLTGMSSAKDTVSKAVLATTHNVGRGAQIAKYKQEYAGVEVFNREYNILMDEELNLVSSSGYFADGASPSITGQLLKGRAEVFGASNEAITHAFNDMGGDVSSVSMSTKPSKGVYDVYKVDQSDVSAMQLVGESRAKQVLFEDKGELVASHYVEIEVGDIDTVDSQFYGYVIAVSTGKVLFKKNLTSHMAEYNYRIYADDTGKPWDSAHGNVVPAPIGSDPDEYLTALHLDAPLVSLAHSTISTMDPWLADDATITQGNNVFAYVDAIAPQGFSNGDFAAEVTSDFTFDYSFDESQISSSANNRKAAIVALFSINNYLHDDFYDHGFDEAAGNAQTFNFGRGGVEGDAMNVEVQDFSGTNNANMTTPADGGAPRMQMFLWDSGVIENGVDFGITVTSDASIGLLETGTRSSLGPDFFRPIEGALVRIEDDTAPINDGCTAPVNADDLNGNIVIIDRGACNFTNKIINAQDAGAIGVIVANNRDGDEIVVLGGTDENIDVPNMSISENDGATIYAAMAAADVTISMFSTVSPEFKGSSWDNGIVAHEWGHYISNRLIGNGSGLDNNQGRSMGEGWGDFHSLLLLSDESDTLLAGNDKFQTGYSGTSYVASFVDGIRRVQYSTDMAVNPLTFSDIEVSAEVHDSGEIWASMLWDSYVGLINDERYTFAQAQELMKDYLVASYKMTPVSPTYTEARDALLSVAFSRNVDDYNVILAAFARRGMGIGAQSPDRDSTTHIGVVESFETDLPALSVVSDELNLNYAGETLGYCSFDNILDKGETGTVEFTIKNDGATPLTDVNGRLVVTSGQDVTFANDGVIPFGDIALFDEVTSAPLEFTLNDAGTADELTLVLTFPNGADGTVARNYSVSTVVNVDFEPRVLTDTIDSSDVNDFSGLNDFAENVMIGGERAEGTLSRGFWGGNDYFLNARNNSFTSDVAFETRAFQVGNIGEFWVNWYHQFNIEEQFDGGVVEISLNGGDWVDVLSIAGAAFEATGYNNTMRADTEAAIAGRQAFTGESVANGEFETINFGSALNGNEVRFRFRISSDSSASESLGWIIDDVTFNNVLSSVFSTQIAGDAVDCLNRLPEVTAVSALDQTVSENTAVSLSVTATDPNSDTLTYAWTQTSGTAVTLITPDSAGTSFTAPQVNANETLTFMVAVSDGTDTVNQNFSVAVNNVVTAAPTPSSSSSGGGSTGWLTLLLTPLVFLRRRK